MTPDTPDDYGVYLFFPPWTTMEKAIARYIERIGEPPEKWFEYNGQIWLGPAPEQYVLRQQEATCQNTKECQP